MVWSKSWIKPCCVGRVVKQSKKIGWSFAHEKKAPAYAFIHSDGSVELAVIKGPKYNEYISHYQSFFENKTTQPIRLGKSKLNNTHFDMMAITSIGLFFTMMLLEWVGLVGGTLTFVSGVSSLLFIVGPKILKMHWEIKRSLLIMLALSLLCFSPFSYVISMPLCLTAFSSAILNLILKDGDRVHSSRISKQNYLLGSALYQVLVCAAFFNISSYFILLAPVSLFPALLSLDNPNIDCDFSLCLFICCSILLATVGMLTNFHYCLHDAVISSILLSYKEIFRKKKVPSKPHFFVFESGESPKALVSDLTILSSRNLQVKLNQGDVSTYVDAGYIKSAKGHENWFSQEDFVKGVIPRGAVISEGDLVAYEQEDKTARKRTKATKNYLLEQYQSEFEHFIMYFVPAALVFSASIGGLIALGSMSVLTGFVVGMGTLLSCCPCVMYVVYDLEEMASHIFEKHLGQEIACNFRNKCWSALLKWPSTIEGFVHIFDRTDTTHKMSAATTSYIKIEDYASSYIRRLMSFKGVIVGCLSAMANSKKYISRYIAEMKDLGVKEPYIKVGQDSYSKPEGKLLELKKAFNSSGVCFYGDGYNDSQIMADSNVLGVGVQYETIDLTVKKRATCVIPDFKNTKTALPLVLEMQKLASTLLLYAVCSNVFLMLLHPIIYIIYGTLFPTWGTCAATVGVGVGLKIKTQLLCSRLSTELAESRSSQSITRAKGLSRDDYKGMIPAPVNS